MQVVDTMNFLSTLNLITVDIETLVIPDDTKASPDFQAILLDEKNNVVLGAAFALWLRENNCVRLKVYQADCNATKLLTSSTSAFTFDVANTIPSVPPSVTFDEGNHKKSELEEMTVEQLCKLADEVYTGDKEDTVTEVEVTPVKIEIAAKGQRGVVSGKVVSSKPYSARRVLEREATKPATTAVVDAPTTEKAKTAKVTTKAKAKDDKISYRQLQDLLKMAGDDCKVKRNSKYDVLLAEAKRLKFDV